MAIAPAIFEHNIFKDMSNIDLRSVRENYNQDGFVFIEGFLNQEEIDVIRQEMMQFIEHTVSKLPENFVFYEDVNDPQTLKQLQDIHTYNPFFAQVLNGSKFEALATLLLEDRSIGKNLEYFNKPARIGKETPPHQDNYYFMLSPPKAVTMWMALEDVNEENGCVRYLKGSHRAGMRPHGRTGTLGFSQGITDYGEDDFAVEVPVPAKAGDLLIHHAMTVHRADANKSNRSRKALGFIYFGESAREDTEAKKAYQQKLQEERLSKLSVQ